MFKFPAVLFKGTVEIVNFVQWAPQRRGELILTPRNISWRRSRLEKFREFTLETPPKRYRTLCYRCTRVSRICRQSTSPTRTRRTQPQRLPRMATAAGPPSSPTTEPLFVSPPGAPINGGIVSGPAGTGSPDDPAPAEPGTGGKGHHLEHVHGWLLHGAVDQFHLEHAAFSYGTVFYRFETISRLF